MSGTEGLIAPTTRQAKLLAINDLCDDLTRGKGPQTSPRFLIRLAQRLTDRVPPIEVAISAILDELEDRLV